MSNIASAKARGFTLIELIITVTILIIIAAIAVPSYRNHVIRTNRSDAIAALQRIAAAQEKFYMQNNTYTDSFGTDGLDIDNTTRFYDLAVTSADTSAFVATAQPRAGTGQADDSACSVMTIDNLGHMSADDGGGTDTTSQCFR